MIHAVESAAEVTGARDFGRRLAQQQATEILGSIGGGRANRPARSPRRQASLSSAGRLLLFGMLDSYCPAVRRALRIRTSSLPTLSAVAQMGAHRPANDAMCLPNRQA